MPAKPVAWRYKVLVNKHATGFPLPGQISMLDSNRMVVWGNIGGWQYSDGPERPRVGWICEAEPLYPVVGEEGVKCCQS